MMSLLRRRAVLLVSLVALGAAAWFTPPLWLRLDGWVQNQRDRVWEQVESVLGQKVVYDRIAPNVLAVLDFQNVRLLATDGTAVFQAASVRLSWDWGLLFQGRFTEALRRVQVINATVAIDSRRDQALIDHWTKFFQPSRSGGGTSFNFQVEGFNLTVRWTNGRQTMGLDRGFAVLSPQGNEWGVKYRGALAWEELAKTPTYARLSVRGEMRADAGFRNLNLRTEASSVRTSWFDLEPLTLQVSIDPEQVTLTKVSDRTPFDLQILWNRAKDQWRFQGAAEQFRPSRLVRIKGQSLWAGVADGTMTGRFSYRLGGDFDFSGRAAWPAGALPAPFAQESVTIEGSMGTQGDTYRFQGFRLETTNLAVGFDGTLAPSGDFPGTLLPDGILVLDRGTFPDWGEARGTIQLSRTGSVVSFSGTDWSWNTLGSTGPSGWVEQTTEGWAYSIRGPIEGTEEGTFWADGVYLPSEPRFEATVELLAMPLSVLRSEAQVRLPGFDLPTEVWALETSLRARVEWDSTGPGVSVTSFAFHDPLIPDRMGTGSAAWRGRHLDLALDPARWDSIRAGGTVSLDMEDGGVVSGSAVGVLWNHPFDLTGRWVPSDRTLAFSGKPGVSAVVHQNSEGVWTAQVALDPQEVAPGWTVGFLGEATLEGDQWSLRGEKITLGGRYPWNQEAFSARAKIKADSSFFRLDELVVNDSLGAWSGTAFSTWSTDFSGPWAGRMAVTTGGGREALNLDWVGTAPDRWHMAVRATGVDVTRAGIPAFNGLVGRIALAGAGDWQGSDGTWTLQTALSEARYGESPLGFRASFSGTTRRIAIRNLNLSLNPVRIVDGAVDLDADTRVWKASLGGGIRVGAGDWESRWALAGQWSPEGAPLQISGTLMARGNSWSQNSFPDWGLSGSWSPSAWSATMTDGGLSVQGAGGAIAVKAQSPFPIRGEAKGTWSGSTFHLDVQGFRADLALIKSFINSKLFSLTSGSVEGDFSVGGTLADPEFNGAIVLRNLTAASSFVRQPLGPVDVPVILEGHRLRIDSVDIGPGEQTWLISGGARIDHLLPEEYQVSVQTDSLSVIPVVYQYTGLSAVGGVTGLLVVKGSPLAVTLGGRLVLQDAIVTLKPASQEAGSGERLGFNADMTLVTGRKVEFLWPNETLPLLRAVAASGQTLAVKANDVASTWSVAGKLGLRTGEINYLNRTFVLKEGQLIFQEDQTRFDPKVSVRAEWRIREASGPITINLRADGTLTGFSPRFDAVPYKSPDELQQLVGTTLALPTDYTKEMNIDAALSVASDVGTSFLLAPFEETVKKNFQLDLFTVKTEILKKSLLNRNASENAPLGASDYLDNTRLFFGKYIGDDLFLQGTLAFRREDGVAAQVSPKMVVEPEFQMEFQTPFFLLNWTLLPQHPETLFVTDNTVTFRWNWSY